MTPIASSEVNLLTYYSHNEALSCIAFLTHGQLTGPEVSVWSMNYILKLNNDQWKSLGKKDEQYHYYILY